MLKFSLFDSFRMKLKNIFNRLQAGLDIARQHVAHGRHLGPQQSHRRLQHGEQHSRQEASAVIVQMCEWCHEQRWRKRSLQSHHHQQQQQQQQQKQQQ